MREQSVAAAFPAGAADRQQRPRVLGAAALVAVLYYLGVKGGLALAAAGSPVFLPLGKALLFSALLLAAPRYWLPLVGAALPAHLACYLGSGLPTSALLGGFVVDCAEVLAAAGAIRAVRGRPLRLDSLADLTTFLLCGALLVPLLFAFIATGLAVSPRDGAAYWPLFGARAASSVLTAVVVPPLLITWAHGYREAIHAPLRSHIESGPVLGGVAIANALLALAAIWAWANGLGPFAAVSRGHGPLSVTFFLIAATVPFLLLAVALDERRRLEAQVRAQRQQLAHLSRLGTLGRLSGALVHELNQPLTAILSNAQAAQHMMGSGSVNAGELRDILGDIVASDRRASEVIGALRALFKNGQPRLQMLNVNQLVSEVLRLARSSLAMHHVATMTRLEPLLPDVRADRVQLEQVLLNLVMNASEAMSVSAVDQRLLTVITHAGARGEVRISIVDHGPGLPSEAAGRLFEAFYTTKPDGLGIGLAVSRAIVAAHGGEIVADVAESGGAAFHVVLPADHRTFVQ